MSEGDIVGHLTFFFAVVFITGLIIIGVILYG